MGHLRLSEVSVREEVTRSVMAGNGGNAAATHLGRNNGGLHHVAKLAHRWVNILWNVSDEDTKEDCTQTTF